MYFYDLETSPKPNDNIIYDSIIMGIAGMCNTAISNTEKARKVNRTLLSVHVKFLNLRAKSSKRETSKSEKTTVIITRTQSWWSHCPIVPPINGSAVMK